jgi:hypothetical protein
MLNVPTVFRMVRQIYLSKLVLQVTPESMRVEEESRSQNYKVPTPPMHFLTITLMH